jgi:alcohol dehydrogenase
MKAIQLEEPFHFKQIDIPEPGLPGPGDALIRVHRVGICGTDYSGYQGKMPFYSYPRIPGHELGVEVLAVGEDVRNVKPGERCSVEPYLNDPSSYASRHGRPNCCEQLQVLGVHTDGGLRPRFIVPARKLHPSAKLTLEQLALVETLGIGYHAVNRSKLQAGETALVIGAGPIGLSVVEFTKIAGARTIVFDINPQRLDFCHRAMGITETAHVRGDGAELASLQEVTGGNLAEVVIDATGSSRSMSNAFNYVAFGGRLVFLGITTDEIRFAQPLMHRREMTFLASRNALPEDFARIIKLLEAGRIDTRPWISHQAGFDDMIGAFPRWLKPETGVIKAMVALD